MKNNNNQEQEETTLVAPLHAADNAELFLALSKAQGELTDPERNKEVSAGKFTYKYAPLDAVLKIVRSVFVKHELCLIQATKIVGQSLILETTIAHSSGQKISSEYPVCSIGADHKAMGGAVTYAKRYALSSLAGIAAMDDDESPDAAPSGTKPPKKMSTHQGKKELDYAAMQKSVDEANAKQLITWDKRLSEMAAIWPNSYLSSLAERIRERRLELADEELQGADMHSLSVVYENVESALDGLVPADDLERLYEKHQARLTGINNEGEFPNEANAGNA